MTRKISSIESPDGADAGFSQIFVFGNCGTKEAQIRITQASGLQDDSQCQATMKLGIVKQLMQFMYRLNPYAKVYQHQEKSWQVADQQELWRWSPLPGRGPIQSGITFQLSTKLQ
ncbi:hypothetical protein PCANC_04166 [Puccinia coronata f. sp. avenae]|uniref:Uncharacterized protein n=1 Tax=Puccinia coronata f. sp. avenae TaxID=200324 RepID=A0A2N5W7F3_9BASI|nr:hypothetical protein PCANC_04166 [Puccinia coronata f. sp. avenae]